MNRRPPTMGPSVHPLLTEIFHLSFWLMGLVLIFVPLERLASLHPQRPFRRGIVTDLGYYFLNSLLPAVLLSVPIGFLAWASHQIVPASFTDAIVGLPLWARVIVGLVAADVGYYWGHRWSHTIPILWRFHAIHHSAEEMDFLVNTRAHPVDMVFGRFCGLVPIYVLGLATPTNFQGSVVPIIVSLIGTFWGFFIHANVNWRFGPLEWLFSTPAFHHWHHTRTGPINRNFASNLPWLDWLFGSLHLPAAWPEEYGIKSKMPSSLIDQLVHPLFPSPSANVAVDQNTNTATLHSSPGEDIPSDAASESPVAPEVSIAKIS